MKRITILFCLLCLGLSAFAQTQRGSSSVGLNIGYGFESENATLGIDYPPSLTYFVKADDLSAVAIDLNAHYVVKLSDVFGFYPLAGIDLAFWKFHHVGGHINDFGRVDDSHNETRLGVNVGIGGEIYATEQLTLGLEVKYNIVKDIDQALLALRVGYNF